MLGIKGSLSVDVEISIDQNMLSDLTIVKWSCFSSSRLFVALTRLFAHVFLVTGSALFDGINQQLEISLLKCIH